MGVLEAKQRKMFMEKVILSCCLILLFLTRFLPFYEIKGIRVVDGFGSIEFHKILFGTVVLIFLIGTWKDNINFMIRFILQNISILIMMFYEILYLFSKDYKFKHTCIGFWLHIAVSVMTIGCCFYYRSRAAENRTDFLT